MVAVSHSVSEQIMFIMSNHFLINFQKLTFKLNFKNGQFVEIRGKFSQCHVVSKNRIKPQNIETLEILEIQTPSNTSELKRFLGMALFS